jgi:hypothetical protein
MAEGLDRRQAVHAVGSVFTKKLFKTMNDPEAHALSLEEYNAAIEQLTAESCAVIGEMKITKTEFLAPPFPRCGREAGKVGKEARPGPHAASWKMTPRVVREPLRTLLTPWRRLTR